MKSVDEPTFVTPHFLPLTCWTFLMGGRAHHENDSMFIPPQNALTGWRCWTARIISDSALSAISTDPPMTALPRSEPLLNATSFALRPSFFHSPRSTARYSGA
jgi:hypothetical protein